MERDPIVYLLSPPVDLKTNFVLESTIVTESVTLHTHTQKYYIYVPTHAHFWRQTHSICKCVQLRRENAVLRAQVQKLIQEKR